MAWEPCPMGPFKVILVAACLLASFSCIVDGARLYSAAGKELASSVSSKSGIRTRDRRLQDIASDICYEGCFAAPLSDPYAVPLPIPLLRAENHTFDSVIQLLDCFVEAALANLTYFAVYDKYDCYGGNDLAMVQGWARDECPLDCLPDGNFPNFCGGPAKASVFSMGVCEDAPCPSPPPSPSPPSPPPPRPFRCKPGIALWGTPLAGSPTRLSNKANHTANTAECERICASNPQCKGYYYKTTHLCYTMAEARWGKQYKTAVQACKAAE